MNEEPKLKRVAPQDLSPEAAEKFRNVMFDLIANGVENLAPQYFVELPERD